MVGDDARTHKSGPVNPPATMHPIKRSQSAPQPVDVLFSPIKPSPGTSKQTNFFRSKSYLVETSSSLVTPWVEREDPFSLGGFFPASRRVAPEEEDQWKWLHKVDDEDRADMVSNSSFSVDNDDIGQLEDKLAEETIKGEDKFGLLSLNNMFTIAESDVDDRLFSPYFEEEAIDNDSLYLSLCARRRANGGLQQSKDMETSAVGALFFPPTKDEAEEHDNHWSRSIFA